MADKTATRNQVKEITDRLEDGVKDLFTSEKYMAYLQTMSRFHSYSTRNTLLIHMQKPDASLVAGFQAWRKNFGRYVKKGEKGIQILAPMPFIIKEERQKLDPDTRKPVLDEYGAPVTEEVERRFARFRVVPVFDVSQTDGKPLPNLVEDLTGDVRHYELFMDALRAVSPLPINFEPLEPGNDGLCRMGSDIAIREGMSEIQTVSAVIHEITHAKLHDIELLRQQDKNAKPKDRRTEEVEAESVSYAVCQYYGIETAPNSFGYLAEWSKTRELKELNASLDTIRKAAAELIDAIDDKYRALAKDRGIDLSAEKSEPVAVLEQAAPASSTAISETGQNEEQLARTAFDRLKPGDMVYLDQAVKPVQLVSVRVGEVLFVVPELAVELTRTHEQVVQSLRDHPQNRHLLEAAELEAPSAPVQAPQEQPSSVHPWDAPDASPYWRAHGLIAEMEKERTRFGREERNLIVNYAMHIADMDLVINFANELADARFEIRHGYADQNVVKRINSEIEALQSVTEPERPPLLRETRPVGETVLMPLLYNDQGDLERTDKRTRVKIEPPIGKYTVYSREDGDRTKGYLLTDSGKLIFIDDYKNMADISEATFDESFANAIQRVLRFMQDPDKRVDFADAAIANRIAEAEQHNAPIREAREAGYEADARESAERKEAERQDHENAFNASVDELSEKIVKGEKADVVIDRYFDKNPIFALFDRYAVDLPLATKGWVNRNLKAFQLKPDDAVTMWLPKGVKTSAAFAQALRELKTAIETDRAAKHVGDDALETKLYEKFAGMFPQFINGEYSYLRLEAGGTVMPLSLERISDKLITVMYSYEHNGDLYYNPKMAFEIGYGENDAMTLTSVEYTRSDPYVYQVKDVDGRWRRIDGNGNEETVWGLQKSMNEMVSGWLDNLSGVGFLPVKANMEIDGKKMEITFDANGAPIMPEPSVSASAPAVTERPPQKPDKQYELGFGHMGNGLTVWNRLEEKNGDYVTVAHIGPDRSVTIYDKDMPDSVKASIEREAKTSNMTVSATQDTPVFNTPPQGTEPERTAPDAEQPAQGAAADILPDSSLTLADMREYGYTHDSMLPVKMERARELYDMDFTVYMLYEDNTEAMVFDRDEITLEQGMFGIDTEEWRSSQEYKRVADERSEGEREAMLVYGEKDAFGIYQMKDGDEMRDYRWESLDSITNRGLSVDRDKYELVYTAPLTIRDKLTNLHKIYETFNNDRPSDFTGHSLSVSDVIVLQWRGEVTSHYVDPYDFKELPSFLGQEKQAELAAPAPEQQTNSQVGNKPEYTGPSVAELDAQVKAGQQISLTDLARAVVNERQSVRHKGKPSILAQLQEYKNSAAQGADLQADTPKHDRNREV